MHVIAFLLLLAACLLNTVLGMILAYALPASHAVRGPNLPYLPLAVAAAVLALGIATVAGARRGLPPPLADPGASRWLVLFCGVVFMAAGWLAANLLLFAPSTFGTRQPMDLAAVMVYLLSAVAASFALWSASHRNSRRRPNLMRYIALGWCAVGFGAATLLSLVLLFAVPANPPRTFAFPASLASLAHLPFAALGYRLAGSRVTATRRT